jgi:hypothetical protein
MRSTHSPGSCFPGIGGSLVNGHPPAVRPVCTTKVVTRDTEVTVNAFFKHSRVTQYLKDGRALRIETVVNSPDDLRCQRRLRNLDELRAKARRRQPAGTRY